MSNRHNIIKPKRRAVAFSNADEKMRTLCKCSPIPTYIWQRQGEDFVLVDYNDAAMAITRDKIAEKVGITASELYRDIPEILNDFSQCFVEKTSIEREMLYRFQTTGESKYLAVKYAFVAPDLVLVHTEDITGRKRIEDALRESEERFRTIVETAPSLLIITDAEGNNIYVSPNCKEFLGYTQEELLGKMKWWVHEDDTARAKALFDSTFRIGAEGRNLEYKAVKKNGELWHASSSWKPFSDKNGKFSGIVFQTFDITERKRADEDIKKFKTISDNANYGAAISDLDGEIVYINEYFAFIHGYKPDEIIGENLVVLHNKEQLKQAKKLSRELLEQGSYNAQEVWHTHKDGSVFPMLMNGILIKAESGKPLFMAASAIDITERKQAEKALRESEEQYRVLYEENPTMYFTVDPNGTVLSVNKFGAEQLGYTIEELVGQSVLNVFYDADKKAVLQQLNACLQNPAQVAKWEFRKVRKDGSLLWVKETVRAVRSTEGKTVVFIVCEDITAAKQVHEALLRITKAVESTGDAVLITDLHGKSIYLNQAFLNLLDYTTDQLNAAGGPSAIYADPGVAREVLKSTQSGDSWRGEVQITKRHGQTIPIYLRSDAIKDENQNIIGLVSIYSDISERVKARNEKTRLLKQLTEAEKMATIGQFTAAITHEINNPLDIILTKLYLLQNSLFKDRQNPELWQHVVKIKQQVFRISHLAKDILNYARPRYLTFQPVEIANVLLQAIDSLSDNLADTVHIETHIEPELPLIQGDAIGLEMVFKNLILNALESSHQSGKIDIAIRMVSKELLEINIKDNGKGIREQDLPKIFDPFFTSKRKSGGTGLGLTICKEIIEQHKGTIKVNSKHNKGTLASIYLSVMDESA